MRLAAGRTGNQTESLTRPAQRLREPNKLLLHAAGLASGSLHARCEPGSGGAETNQAPRRSNLCTSTGTVAIWQLAAREDIVVVQV